MRYWIEDPANSERVIVVPPNVVKQIRQDALDAAREAVRAVNWFNDEGKMLSAVVATADSIAAIDALRKSK